MEFASGNVYIREMRFDKSGDAVDGHAHDFDHTTYVVRGALRIEKLCADGSVERSIDKRARDGHNWVLIKAGVRHRIIAIENDSLGHCIYSHRTPQGDVIQTPNDWGPAYG